MRVGFLQFCVAQALESTSAHCATRLQMSSLFSPCTDLKHLLHRPQKGNSRVEALDGVRCAALLWVFALHSTMRLFKNCFTMEVLGPPKLADKLLEQWWAQFAMQGGTGVDMFYVLSGFLISRSYMKHTPEISTARHATSFLIRRFFRIWPMVVAAVLTCFLLAAFVPDFRLHWTPEVAWAQILMIPQWVDGALQTELYHLWSVSTEMQMYLLTPLLCELLYDRAQGCRRRGAFLLLGILSLGCVSLRAWFAFGPADMVEGFKVEWRQPIYLSVFARFSPYLSGIALHLALQEPQEPAQNRPVMLGIRRLIGYLVDFVAVGVMVLSLFVGQQPRPGGPGRGIVMRALDPLSLRICVVVQPPLFGWALARCLFHVLRASLPCDATLWDHMKPWLWCKTILSFRLWWPLAVLSYGAYVMQLVPSAVLALFLNDRLKLTTVGLEETDLLGVTWRVVVSFFLYLFMSYLAALLMHLIVEMPGIRLGQLLDKALWSALGGWQSPRDNQKTFGQESSQSAPKCEV